MTDNELINIVATQLDLAVASGGWPYIVLQKNQPTQEGVPTEPTVFFEKISDHRYGCVAIDRTYRPIQDDFAETETQVFETTFQISALVIQNPSDLSLPTASDVVNQVCMFMQSRFNIAAMLQNNVSMMRVTDVRNPYFADDKDRFESHPNFDFVVTYNKSITLTAPAAVKAVGAPSNLPGSSDFGVFFVPDYPGQTISQQG